MTRTQSLFSIGLLALAAVAACQGSKTTSIACTSFASAEELCAGRGCDPTWSAVETNRSYCDTCAGGTRLAGDCGDYHVLTYTGLDTGSSYYYRRDTGALVAAEFWSPPSPTGTCLAVGTAAFPPPVSCNTTMFSMLPGWCSPDAGAPGERVFPCCSSPLPDCSLDTICPATWAQAQAQAPSLCDPQNGETNPQLGSCGGDHVFRYRLNATTPLALYYDASGALIAVVNETLDRCAYGALAGLTLPACDATPASACSDGGASP